MKRTRKSVKPGFLLSLTIEQVGPSRYLGRCASLPGFLVECGSIEEVVREAPKVARALVKAMAQKGVDLPRAMRVPENPRRVRLLVAA